MAVHIGTNGAVGRRLRVKHLSGEWQGPARRFIDGVIVPDGALDRWFDYMTRTSTEHGDVIVFGDSTTWGAEGSGANYSWLTRLRTRMVGAGLTDGGKGIFGGFDDDANISYDAPEVTGIVSSEWAYGSTDHDNIGGVYFYNDGATPGAQLVLRFRTEAFRLWLRRSWLNSTGITYSVDGGDPVTVENVQIEGGGVWFEYVNGFTKDETHTLTITNLGGPASVALAPVNETGVTLHKHALNGATINGFFMQGSSSAPWTQQHNPYRMTSAFGLTQGNATPPNYPEISVDTDYTSGRINPVLAIAALGFNDLSNSQTAEFFEQYVRRFAAACRIAECDGVVTSGQLPYNAKWPTHGPDAFAALRDTAVSLGMCFADSFIPVAGPSLSYVGGTANPHLPKSEYVAQADWLWDNLLGA